MPEELWLPIPGFDEYEISNTGRVKTLKTRGCWRPKDGILTLKPDTRNGYIYTHLQKNNKAKSCRVHRLVMLAFVGVCPEKYQVNHKNGIKSDNRLDNLEYVTNSENQQHRFLVLGHQGQPGEKNPASKISDSDTLEIREKYATGNYLQSELALEYNVTPSLISMIINHKRRGSV